MPQRGAMSDTEVRLLNLAAVFVVPDLARTSFEDPDGRIIGAGQTANGPGQMID